ncbi:hypothetical protein DP113_22420 [Brasilonema octagenarum UFV-E1]|uniref:Uncharacterized protein n=2 Tax=Brasilonema TaxID=383614 RepID=A0A856MJ45_9CYAN|nr:hypothetical protein [Brasilonema octagenarum UFV-OR1]QDL10299.1 hypothetical protein DP114_22505 [Brasilonema sennae CENA114]QDL16648.1 hypothetical protein DP113_22420 [Brasilonema octagenarum UFV-E1]
MKINKMFLFIHFTTANLQYFLLQLRLTDFLTNLHNVFFIIFPGEKARFLLQQGQIVTKCPLR